MTRFAPPVPLGESWLERRSFRHDQLEERLEFWRAREASFVRHAPFDLEEPGPRIERETHGRCELWLPVKRIARDAHALVAAHFDLGAVDPDWRSDLLAGARSWIEARRRMPSLPSLPSHFLGSLVDPVVAEAFVFAAHDPASFGSSFDRYPEALTRIAALRPRRVWDAGCGTGETTHELGRVAGEVLGTTPSPWELLMARRRGRPHDRARSHSHRRRTEGVTNVRFEAGALRRGGPDGFDVVFVGGVLGGVVFEEEDIETAVHAIARALVPGGRVVVVDRFRSDRHARAERLVERAARGAGLDRVEAGVFGRAP